jgi:hypothetical protein
LERVEENGELVYNVEVVKEKKDRWDSFYGEQIYVRNGVPRDAIRFWDLPYTSDLQLRNAFRHEIGIPDSILPEAWRTTTTSKAELKQGGDEL